VLRSGSPLMIVEDFGHVSDSVNVVWFDKSQVRRDAFHYLALAIAQVDMGDFADWFDGAETTGVTQ
jgi:uncharacterized protein YodC (DUF2158 family)